MRIDATKADCQQAPQALAHGTPCPSCPTFEQKLRWRLDAGGDQSLLPELVDEPERVLGGELPWSKLAVKGFADLRQGRSPVKLFEDESLFVSQLKELERERILDGPQRLPGGRAGSNLQVGASFDRQLRCRVIRICGSRGLNRNSRHGCRSDSSDTGGSTDSTFCPVPGKIDMMTCSPA